MDGCREGPFRLAIFDKAFRHLFEAITTDQEPEYADVGWDITQTAIVT
ncbi:MAG: hypothetical protein JWR09_4105, partial [Mucilaginibacter sp.]|nr:hypothetical protein [Mucilaginibacter sp.]